MLRMLLNGEVGKGVTAIPPLIQDTVRWRCCGCGLEWEASHDEEECPLSLLEKVFLAEDWFTGSDEINDECR